MGESHATLDEFKRAPERGIVFLFHALRLMSKPDRMIGTADVRQVIANGEVIEDCILHLTKNEFYHLKGMN